MLIARSDRTARICQNLGYLKISCRNLHKINVRQLSENTTCESLLNYYSRFGKVRAIRLLEDLSPRQAFIYYDNFEEVHFLLESVEVFTNMDRIRIELLMKMTVPYLAFLFELEIRF